MDLPLSVRFLALAGHALARAKLESGPFGHLGVAARRFEVALHGTPPFELNAASTHFILCIIAHYTSGIYHLPFARPIGEFTGPPRAFCQLQRDVIPGKVFV